MIASGRLPSWLSASSQVFVPSTVVFSVALVFVTTNPFLILPNIEAIYPFSTPASLTVYSICLPALYSSNSAKLPVQLFSWFNTRVLSVF